MLGKLIQAQRLAYHLTFSKTEILASLETSESVVKYVYWTSYSL